MKRMSITSILLMAFGVMLLLPSKAQTPTDALMMETGQICLAAIYTHDTWDEYWEGTLKRNNGNIGTLTRQTVMPMVALGVIDRVNVIAALPWVKTQASGGQMTGVQGLQDWGFWIKGTAVDQEIGSGKLTLHAVAGVSGPASNYLPDYAPFNLGFGCLEGSLRGVLQYQTGSGIFVRGQGAFHLRGNSTIERDYYYTTQGFYTDEVDMPDAISYGAVAGIWLLNNSLKVEAMFDGLKSLGGFDIRRQDAGFPSNKMIFTRVGGGLQYYFPFVKGLGVVASGGYVLTGRNVGQSLALSGGITYQFGIW
ncbi:MAG: transporter [Saprospiraceae bacterium]|nr:transporter [Saprospiraceae bacterium]